MSAVMPEIPKTPQTPQTPQTPLKPLTPIDATAIPPPTTTPSSCVRDCIGRRSNSQQNENIDTDSGKSSDHCSPTAALLDCSFDSGIGGVAIESHDLQLHKRIQHCKRILIALERDKDTYRMLRERLSKLVDKDDKKATDEEQICNVCCTELDVNDNKSSVVCCTCKKNICSDAKCVIWIPKFEHWECQLCHSSKESMAQTSSWVAEQMSFNQQKFIFPMRARSEIYIPINDCHDSSMNFESVSQVGVNSAAITAEQKLKIREYVEEVVAQLVGGSLDNIAVGQMSKSENYLPALINRNNNAPTPSTPTHDGNNSQRNDFSEFSERRLRQLIESIIAETLRLPSLPSLPSGAVSEISLDTRSNGGALPLTNGITRRHRTEHYFEPKIYQDLLATAVLNKIVDKQNIKNLSESSPDLTIDPNFNVENQSTSSGSSVEPRSECSYTDNDRVLKINKDDEQNLNDNLDSPLILTAGRESVLSDYIASHMVPLPDLSTPATESEEDDYASGTSSTVGDGTWEENWLFKKKRSSLQTSVTGSSSGMLVPAPKEDVRAQIGDKTTDEISDLSEIGSDTDDSSLNLLSGNMDPLNNRLLNKHLIGGQNTKLVLDEMIDSASMISNTSLAENVPKYIETTNEHLIDTNVKSETFNLNVTKAETELLSPSSTYENFTQTTDLQTANPLTGSIAEREYKKWNNAVEMPNNPYAPEALKRRISGSQERFIDLPNISPSTEQNPIDLIKTMSEQIITEDQNHESDYKRYSRDYYINDTKQTITGAKYLSSSSVSISNISDETTSDNITINEAKIIKTASEQIKTDTESEQSLSQHPKQHDIYQALPAHVIEDAGSLETLSNQSLQSVNTTTSDDSDTVRVYDFNKQETTTIHRDNDGINQPDTTPIATATAPTTTAPTTTTTTSNVQQTTSTTEEVKEIAKDLPEKKERPTELPLSSTTPAQCGTPTRGSTPTAFKFLQPKRKLIEPNQVLSFDENEPDIQQPPPVEKTVIEKEVVQQLPSVKALAKAFLLTSKMNPQVERRWGKARTLPENARVLLHAPIRKMETSPSVIEVSEDNTISSDISSLETDPPTYDEANDSQLPPGSESDQRPGVLKNNIAFFENLKFK